MPLDDLLKIGDPTVEYVRSFPEDHDLNIDILQSYAIWIENQVSRVETDLSTLAGSLSAGLDDASTVSYDGNPSYDTVEDALEDILGTLPNYVSLTGNEIIAGEKTFSNDSFFTGNVTISGSLTVSDLKNVTTISPSISGSNVIIDTFDSSLGDVCEWLVSIKNGTNLRASKVLSVWDGVTGIEYTETGTNDLGDTSGVTLGVNISGGNISLTATTTTTSGLWSIKTKRALI